MTRTNRLTGRLAATGLALLTTGALASALAQPPEPPPRPEGGPPPEHRDPLRGALDANHDFELDDEEIAKAPEAIKKLDKNGDGTIDREELRPPMGPPPGGRGPGPEGRRPEGRPPREDESPEGPPRPRESGRPAGGPPGDRPSPERFMERAKAFDTDGDGKLDEGELKKLAESMAERMRAGRLGSSGGPPREGGDRPERPRRPE